MQHSQFNSHTDSFEVIGHQRGAQLVCLRVVAASVHTILALCENENGRFIRIVQGDAKVIIPSNLFLRLQDALLFIHREAGEIEGHVASGITDPENRSRPIHTEAFSVGRRRYYIDLLQSANGTLYLRISQRAGRRSKINIDASGIASVYEAVSRLVEHDAEAAEAAAVSPHPEGGEQDSREGAAGAGEEEGTMRRVVSCGRRSLVVEPYQRRPKS